MHIALNGWFWDQPYTGSGQYLRGLIGGLARLNTDLDLTLIVPPHIQDFDGLPETVSLAQSPSPPRFGGKKLAKVWFEQRLFPSMVGRVGADLAHIPYWGAPLSSPVPMVVSVLDVIPLVLPQAYSGGVFNKLYISLVTASAQGAAHIITLSEASKNDITTHLNIQPEKITPIYLAADDRFSPNPTPEDEAVRAKYNLPDEFALYFGGFDQRKNVNTLLLAWTYVGQPMGEFVPLVLAGKQPAEWGTRLYPDFPAYVRELAIEDYVIWLGEVAEADKPALYRLAKVTIFPSLYEGFGLPALESMASGTPVVASNASAIPEVVGEAAYLVDPTDAREMGGAILATLVQDDLTEHLANLGRGQATNFSWRKTAQQTLAVYQDVLNG